MTMPEHVQRVYDEQGQLAERCKNLQSFFGTLTFKALKDEDKSLLRAQFKFMISYLDVLNKRIERFINDNR